MAVSAAPLIPALADRPAPAAGAGEADGHPHPVGQGRANVSNSGAMPAATPFSQLSRLSWIISLSPFNRRWAMASAIGPAVVANSRERGGQRESAGVVRA